MIDFTYQHHVDHLYWLMLLGLIVMFGSGPLSLDLITDKLLRRHFRRLVIAAVPQRAS